MVKVLLAALLLVQATDDKAAVDEAIKRFSKGRSEERRVGKEC